jgi:glyoxylase-like metal-dependent hydrolase (beta-lactamase superfamily II)
MIHPGIGSPHTREVAPGVFAILRLVHFFADIGVNAGIIQTANSVVFIDSGMSAYSGQYLWSIAENKMVGNEELFLILTHKDTDHCFGMNDMKKQGAKVIAHEYSAKVIHEYRDVSKHPIVKRIRKEYKTEDVLGEVILTMPDQLISEDTTLDLGTELHILTVEGHTPGDVAIYHPESKVLFSGDAILEGMNPYIRPDSIDIETWIRNLKKLKKLDIEWICPGHGALSKPDIIDKNIKFLEGEMPKSD